MGGEDGSRPSPEGLPLAGRRSADLRRGSPGKFSVTAVQGRMSQVAGDFQLCWKLMGTEGRPVDLATWRPFRLQQELLAGTVGTGDGRADGRRGGGKGFAE